jgi:xanthine permease XanP
MRADYAVQELAETIVGTCEPRGPMKLDATFDEFNLDMALSYTGKIFEATDTRPSSEEILESPEGLRRLSGFLLRRYANRVSTSRRDGACVVRLHFDH